MATMGMLLSISEGALVLVSALLTLVSVLLVLVKSPKSEQCAFRFTCNHSQESQRQFKGKSSLKLSGGVPNPAKKQQARCLKSHAQISKLSIPGKGSLRGEAAPQESRAGGVREGGSPPTNSGRGAVGGGLQPPHNKFHLPPMPSDRLGPSMPIPSPNPRGIAIITECRIGFWSRDIPVPRSKNRITITQPLN
jgi:hypothetical protein